MRNVAIWICMQVLVRLSMNLLQLAVVYLVAKTLFSILRKGTRWSFKLAAIILGNIVSSTRRAKAKAKKLATTIPPPTYPHQHFSSLDQQQISQFGPYSPLDTIPESPLESEMSELEDSVIVG